MKDRSREPIELRHDQPIDLYIYANNQDMQDAVLYEPSWTGGLAFPEHNIVIMGLPDTPSDWEQRAIVHEITHVLVGHLTFSCLGVVPTWLNEGLAEVEGRKEFDSPLAALEGAVKTGAVLPFTSLEKSLASMSGNDAPAETRMLANEWRRSWIRTLGSSTRIGLPSLSIIGLPARFRF